MSLLLYRQVGRNIKLLQDTHIITMPTPKNLLINVPVSISSHLRHNHLPRHIPSHISVISNTTPSPTSPTPPLPMPSSPSMIPSDSDTTSTSNIMEDAEDAADIAGVGAPMGGILDRDPSLSTSRDPRSPSLAASPGSWSTPSTAAASSTTPSRTRATGAYPRRS